jgi:hypothetical protein
LHVLAPKEFQRVCQMLQLLSSGAVGLPTAAGQVAHLAMARGTLAQPGGALAAEKDRQPKRWWRVRCEHACLFAGSRRTDGPAMLPIEPIV